MDSTQAEQKVRKIIVEKLGVQAKDVTLTASLTGNLNADSLDLVELIMAIEEEFEVEIPDQEAGELDTLEDVLDYLEKQEVQTT